MNGKEAIDASDSDSILSAGFVSGDTVHVLGVPESAQCVQLVRTLPSTTSIANTGNKHGSCSKGEEQQSGKGMHMSVTTKRSADIPLAEVDVRQSPNLFTELLACNPDKFSTDFEKFCGLLHILMVEGGFIPVTTRNIDTKPLCCTLPESWTLKQGTLKLDYKSSYPPYPKCSLVVSSIGPLAIVHGQTLDRTGVTWKVKPRDFADPHWKNLAKLSLEFKNQIVYPIFVTIQREAHGICPINLSNLPPELSNLIFKKLDATSLCRLSCTSHQFRQLIDDSNLWKRFLYRWFITKLKL